MPQEKKEIRIYSWGHERRFNAFSNYLKKLYGARIQKVAVDAGFICPNRDGTKGTGGCTYCNNDAFNPGYCTPDKTVSKQIEEGIEFHKWRYRRAYSYLAYFQAYTNTYAGLDTLRSLYEEALSYPGVVGLVIGTRPDCIDDLKINYLKELAEKYYIAIEYGVESCSDITLRRINRGHSFKEARIAIEKTSAAGINTGAHFIFGLPGESRSEMLRMAEIISAMPLSTVKFHQLQIMKGTAIEKEYRDNPNDFLRFSLEEYIDFIVEFVERLNPSLVIERFTGEAPPRFLSEITWGKTRTEQAALLIEKRLEELDTWQGRLHNPSDFNFK